MKVVKFEPGKPGEIIEIENTTVAMQQVVGGYFEQISLPDKHVIICNEEAKPLNLPYNRAGIYGTFLICKVKGSHYASINDSKAKNLLTFGSN